MKEIRVRKGFGEDLGLGLGLTEGLFKVCSLAGWG